MKRHPSPSVSFGERHAQGQFLRGNRAGTGNPHHKAVARLRAALLEAVSVQDMEKVAAAFNEEVRTYKDQGD